MNIESLVKRLNKRHGFKKEHAHRMVTAMLEEIEKAVAREEDVEFKGYLAIKIFEWAPRLRIDPQGREHHMPAQKRIRCRPGALLKRAVGYDIKVKKRRKESC